MATDNASSALNMLHHQLLKLPAGLAVSTKSVKPMASVNPAAVALILHTAKYPSSGMSRNCTAKPNNRAVLFSNSRRSVWNCTVAESPKTSTNSRTLEATAEKMAKAVRGSSSSVDASIGADVAAARPRSNVTSDMMGIVQYCCDL